MYKKNMKMKMFWLVVIGSTIMIGHATYVKMQREKRQKMHEVLEEARQSLLMVESNPNQVHQTDYHAQ